MKKYNFIEDKKTMVITTKSILKCKKDIVVVSHDEDDGMWEFLDGDDVVEEEASIVSLEEILEIDNSINELFDLQLGWLAYRENKSSEWIRCIN